MITHPKVLRLNLDINDLNYKGTWLIWLIMAPGESYCNTARALVGAQHWRHALQLIRDFREAVATPAELWSGEGDRSLCQLLLSIYSDRGTWKDILKVLDEAQEHHAVTADRSCAMQALTKLGCWQRALQVMADTRSEEYDTEMYVAGMSAWVFGFQWRKVFELLGQMEDNNLKLDEQVYGKALAACNSVAGRECDEAASAAKATSQLLQDMLQRGLSVTRRQWHMVTCLHFRHVSSCLNNMTPPRTRWW